MKVLLQASSAMIAVATLGSGVAMAQTSPTPTTGPTRSTGLAEVVVTAQRRSENLQKVPVAVTAIPAETIIRRGASNLLELQRLSPSLTVQDTASNISPFIRGVGTTVSGAGQSASVATYVDGVYVSTLTSAAFDLDSIDNLQILEGPQGALYGRNATGGAIVITHKTPHPDDAFSGTLRAEYGNYDSKVVSGTISSGLGEKFAASLSGSYRNHDGYIKNLDPAGFGTNHDDLNDRNSWSVSGALTFQPSDRFSAVLRASHFFSKDHSGVGLQAVGVNINALGTGLNGSQLYYGGFLQSFGFPPAAAGAAAANLRFSNQIGATYDNENNGFTRGLLPGARLPGSFVALDTSSVSLKMAYDADLFTVSSITAYTDAKSSAATEIVTANPSTYPSGFQGGSVGFSGYFPSTDLQEDFQITSTKASRIQWVAGAFYIRTNGPVLLTGDVPPFSSLTVNDVWTNSSEAGYAQATVPIVSKFSVTLGGRYTAETYRLVDHISLTDPRNLFGTPNVGPQPDLDNDRFTYTARAQYDNGPLLLYFGVATGFKGATRAAVSPSDPGIKPETITSYEGGVKWSPLPSARINASVFHYDYTNIQIATTQSATGSTSYVNGPSAKIDGGELEGLWRATSWLTLRSNSIVMGSSYDANSTAAGGNAPLQTKGRRLAGAPSFVFSAGVDLTKDIAYGTMKLSIDATHNDGYYFDAENLIGTGGANANGFTTVDASLTFSPVGKRFEISAFGTNILDERYYNSGLSASSLLRTALEATPALYGVRVRVNF